MTRRISKVVKIGNVSIGGNNPIAIQSMVKVPTADTEAVLKQIRALHKVGCQIVRVAVKDTKDAYALRAITKDSPLPVVADIHFDWRLAITAIECGVHKIRLNPGNIVKKEQVQAIARAAKQAHIPIRVGVNSGSVARSGRKGLRMTNDMVESAKAYIQLLEGFRFNDIVVSLKGSNIFDTLDAYRIMAKRCDYPLHIGVTATGSLFAGAIKSSIALGALLMEGIGDTIRVSLSDQPEEEVRAAKMILEALHLGSFGPEVISCPTCGRCEVDVKKIVKQLEGKLSTIDYRPSTRSCKVAIMGCVVNGPGEAKEADIGVAFGKKYGMLFKKGKMQKKIPAKDAIGCILSEIGRRS
ncbi:MAG: flavodoxin-dependent (E)-4-hydroxy-3-methylbut-2-enyl-diphosphate synthase [Candidatus Omnitrophica bacterium]|nr:flavodoxin-dependent (E)-4-hydroxy-3-methylbut-2-enyl-diphosphate synthase [Candidatus Omnitrophota bacterium]